MRTIFVLTCLSIEDGAIARHRTWGWFPKAAGARRAALMNDGDMYEDGYYNHAVIEEVCWGSAAEVESEEWFSAEMLSNGEYVVRKIEKPPFLDGCTGFGMG